MSFPSIPVNPALTASAGKASAATSVANAGTAGGVPATGALASPAAGAGLAASPLGTGAGAIPPTPGATGASPGGLGGLDSGTASKLVEALSATVQALVKMAGTSGATGAATPAAPPGGAAPPAAAKTPAAGGAATGQAGAVDIPASIRNNNKEIPGTGIKVSDLVTVADANGGSANKLGLYKPEGITPADLDQAAAKATDPNIKSTLDRVKTNFAKADQNGDGKLDSSDINQAIDGLPAIAKRLGGGLINDAKTAVKSAFGIG